MQTQSYTAFFTTSWGIETVCAQELRERFGLKPQPNPHALKGYVQANIATPLELVRICYQAHTIHRGLLILDTAEIRTDLSGLDDIYALVKRLDLDPWLDPQLAFAIRSNRLGKQAFRSPDIMRVAGQAVIDRIQERHGYRQRVNLDAPDLILRVDVVNSRCIVGIDFVGEISLHKRGYRVYDHPASLRPTLAAAMLRLAGWQPDQPLLDPMCGGGTIPIQAALEASNVPAGFFRKEAFAFRKLRPFHTIPWDDFLGEMDAQARWRRDLPLFASDKSPKHVEGARRNVEAAGFADTIRVEQRDALELNPCDYPTPFAHLITNPPFGIRMARPREVRRLYHRFFQVVPRVLQSEGRLTLIAYDADLVRECADRYAYRMRSVTPTMHGDLEVTIFVLELDRH